MTPEQFMAGCEAEPLGDSWGKPLWRFYNEDASISIDVHAADEAEACATALEAAAPVLEDAA